MFFGGRIVELRDPSIPSMPCRRPVPMRSAFAIGVLPLVLLLSLMREKPVAASNANNYFCKGCATVMEHVWRNAEPMIQRISSKVTAGSAANATVDIKGLVVDGICKESILADGFDTSNLGGRFSESHHLAYVSTIRDACTQMVDKNAQVIAGAFSGNFPDLADLYTTMYDTCVTQQDLCNAPEEDVANDEISGLDKCESCKSVVGDTVGVLTRSKGSADYLSRKHVWSVLEEECSFIVSRFPKRIGLRLQEACQDLLQDYDEDIVDVLSSADSNPVRTICGKQTARMCRKGKENKWSSFLKSLFHASSDAQATHYEL